MKKNRKWIQIVILAAVLVVGGYTIFDSLGEDKVKLPKVGSNAPEFTLPGLDGQDHKLSDYRGKTVVLNFWGSFCEPCVREMPLLQEMAEKHADDLVVLGVNLDEKLVTVKSFVELTDVTFPILLDHTQVQKQYGVMYYPTTYFIDAQGKITYKKIGEIKTAEEIEAHL